ncbi:MAG: biotin transporter BioY [Alphaproteobacteria bacterium]|nr:biotin transporter BioY [Alphaproteobacteria bacterium]
MTLYAALTTKPNRFTALDLLVVVAASLLLTLAAKISIPFFPVPLTMQTFVVVGLGLALGPTLGVAAVGLYLLQGAIGLPVFSGTPEKGIGLAYLAGPTGGYLIGYLPAVFATGWLAVRGWDRNIIKAFLAALAGAIILYIPGLLWLGTLMGWDKPILAWGLYPFIPGDLAKTALAAIVFPATWRFLRQRGLV